jgi:hypothetical protein
MAESSPSTPPNNEMQRTRPGFARSLAADLSVRRTTPYVASMRTYDLDVPLLVRALPFVMLGMLTFVFPILVLRDGPIFLLPLFLAIAAWNWWVVLTLAYRVVIHDDGIVEWVALARRVKTLPEDVQRIAPDRTGSIGFFSATHARGKVRFINQITGFMRSSSTSRSATRR